MALSSVPVTSATPSANSNGFTSLSGLEETSDELGEDEATVVSTSISAAHKYDFHMVYSPAYRVPLLLLRGQRLDGTLLTEEEMAADLPAQTAEVMNDGRKWLFLTRQVRNLTDILRLYSPSMTCFSNGGIAHKSKSLVMTFLSVLLSTASEP